MVVNKRIIYLIMAIGAIVLVVELAWAYSALYKTSQNTPPAVKSILDSSAKVSLTTSSTNVKVGDQISVVITITSTALTDGTDLIINFDPKALEVVPITNVPVSGGSIYTEYPNNKLDLTKGIIAVSGISSEKDGRLANGVFGTIIFKAKALGNTNINVMYSPGATDESNVIETATGKDILGSVQNLQLNITL